MQSSSSSSSSKPWSPDSRPGSKGSEQDKEEEEGEAEWDGELSFVIFWEIFTLISWSTGGVHHDGLWAEDEEVQFPEGGESQVCAQQDLDSLQNASVRAAGDVSNLFKMLTFK